jgi:hypothetical protein
VSFDGSVFVAWGPGRGVLFRNFRVPELSDAGSGSETVGGAHER